MLLSQDQVNDGAGVRSAVAGATVEFDEVRLSCDRKEKLRINEASKRERAATYL